MQKKLYCNFFLVNNYDDDEDEDDNGYDNSLINIYPLVILPENCLLTFLLQVWNGNFFSAYC